MLKFLIYADSFTMTTFSWSAQKYQQMYLAEPGCLFLPPFQASFCYCLVWLIFQTECFRQGQQQWYRNTQKAQEGGFILTALPFCIQTSTWFSRLSGFKEQCFKMSKTLLQTSCLSQPMLLVVSLKRCFDQNFKTF